MLTLTQVEVHKASISDDGTRSTLHQPAEAVPEGKEAATMEMKLLSPPEAKFEVLVTNDQKYNHDYDKVSDRLRQVVTNLEVPAGTDKTLAVFFRPGSVPSDRPEPDVTPIGGWAELSNDMSE
jgi:hypothetical protein